MKRRKCWLPAFSPLSTIFSKAFFVRSLKVGIVWWRVRISALSKLKAFADDNLTWCIFFLAKKENIVRIGEKTGKQHFLLFPQYFLSFPQNKFHFFDLIYFVICKCFQIWSGLNLVVWYRVNPFPYKPWFVRVCSKMSLKTLWEKDKMLLTSNFSFFHSVFYPFVELSFIFIKVKIIVCKLFQFGRV